MPGALDSPIQLKAAKSALSYRTHGHPRRAIERRVLADGGLSRRHCLVRNSKSGTGQLNFDANAD
jgi:hypothetical protein